MSESLAGIFDQNRSVSSFPYARIDEMSTSTALISPVKRPSTSVKRSTPKQRSSCHPFPRRL